MFHKILESYFKNIPYDNEDHPDGPLWPLTLEELEDMPKGIRLETLDGKLVTVGHDDIDTNITQGYLPYGIRGFKDD